MTTNISLTTISTSVVNLRKVPRTGNHLFMEIDAYPFQIPRIRHNPMPDRRNEQDPNKYVFVF